MAAVVGAALLCGPNAGGAGDGVSVTQTPIFLPQPPDSADGEDAAVCSNPDVEGSAFGFSLPGPVLTDDGDSAWVASFVVPTWRGELNRVSLSTESEDQEYSVPGWDERHVLTYNPDDDKGVAFRWNNLTAEQQRALANEDNDISQLSNDGKARLKYLRGDHSNEERNGGPFRDRTYENNNDKSWELGDTVHSRPVIVGEPPFLFEQAHEEEGQIESGYGDFVDAQADRKELVYVGANDGMLHAFDSETGEEAFAYLPAEDLKAGTGGGLIFTKGNDQQLASLIDGSDGFEMTEIVDDGKKDTKGIDATAPAIADFDGNGDADVAYLKNQSPIRVLDSSSQTASTKISLNEGDKARKSKTRLAVGSFESSDNDKIFYVNEDEERIMYLEKSGGDWSTPELAAHVGDNDGANAIAGFGDIDGDGQDELVYADASQDPHFLEKCDMDYTTETCPENEQAGKRLLWTPGGTPGSNNGIGYGNVAEYDGDDRNTKGLIVTDGSNNMYIYYPKHADDPEMTSSNEGAREFPQEHLSPYEDVRKGTQITDCGDTETEGHCASKSPSTASDIDGDGDKEIVFAAEDANDNLAEMRYCDSFSGDDGLCDEVKTVETTEGDTVKVRQETGVTGGDSAGGDTLGATLVERVGDLTSPDYQHQYYVDGSPTYGDAYFDYDHDDSKASTWKSVVVTPFGRGEQGVFAIDATEQGDRLTKAEDNPAEFPLWTFDDEDHRGVGNVINKASVVRLNNDEWAVVFGNGYNNTKNDNHQSETGKARLYIVDVETGDLIKTISTGEGQLQDPTEEGRANSLGPVAPVDTNGDSVVDLIYAGDLFGNLWKFDVSSSSKSDWSIVDGEGDSNKTAIFAAEAKDGTHQPITVRPVVTHHPHRARSGQMVYFGTGKYVENSDHSRTGEPTQTIYGLWVNETDQTYDRDAAEGDDQLLKQEIKKEKEVDNSDETVRTISKHEIDWSTHTGWFLDLKPVKPVSTKNRGERLVAPPQYRNGALLVNTILPAKNRVCDSTNPSWLMKLDAVDGSRLAQSAFNLDDYEGTPVSGVQTESGSSTGGGSVYQIPHGGSGVVKSSHPGVVNQDVNQSLDIRDYESSGDPTGRQYWQQLR